MSNTPKRKSFMGVNVAIFENEYNGKINKSYKFQKSYKDKDGNWQNTDSYFTSDLANLKVLVDRLLIEAVRSHDTQKPTQTYPEQEKLPSASPQVDKTANLNDPSLPF